MSSLTARPVNHDCCAETFKYLFLLMDPDRSISLDTHVLNTEAHPFSIIGDNMPGFVPFVVR